MRAVCCGKTPSNSTACRANNRANLDRRLPLDYSPAPCIDSPEIMAVPAQLANTMTELTIPTAVLALLALLADRVLGEPRRWVVG